MKMHGNAVNVFKSREFEIQISKFATGRPSIAPVSNKTMLSLGFVLKGTLTYTS